MHRDSRDARAPFERKFSVDATDTSQLFYLKRKFIMGPFCPVRKCGGKQRKERNSSARGNVVCAPFLFFFVLFLSFASSYSFFPFRLILDTYTYR